jgi:hypothetical protein
MFFLVNPSKIIVEVDEYAHYTELLSTRGFRDATELEIKNFKKDKRTSDIHIETDSELKEWILLALNNSTSIEKLERVRNLLNKVK